MNSQTKDKFVTGEAALIFPYRPYGQALHAIVMFEIRIVFPNRPGGQPIIGQVFNGGNMAFVMAIATGCPNEFVQLKAQNTPELFGRFEQAPLKGETVHELDAHNCIVVSNGTIEVSFLS